MLFEHLDLYIILRLVCENPANLDQNVIWRFQDVFESGWISGDLDDRSLRSGVLPEEAPSH